MSRITPPGIDDLLERDFGKGGGAAPPSIDDLIAEDFGGDTTPPNTGGSVAVAAPKARAWTPVEDAAAVVAGYPGALLDSVAGTAKGIGKMLPTPAGITDAILGMLPASAQPDYKPPPPSAGQPGFVGPLSREEQERKYALPPMPEKDVGGPKQTTVAPDDAWGQIIKGLDPKIEEAVGEVEPAAVKAFRQGVADTGGSVDHLSNVEVARLMAARRLYPEGIASAGEAPQPEDRSAVKDFLTGLPQGAISQAGEGIAGFLAAQAESVGSPGVADEFRQTQTRLATETAPKSKWQQAGQVIGQVIPQGLATVTGASGPANAMMALMGIQSYASQVNQYRADKQQRGEEPDPNEAAVVGLAGAAIELASEKMGLDYIAERMPRLRVAIENFKTVPGVKTAAAVIDVMAMPFSTEAIEEGSSQLGQNIVRRATSNPEQDISEGVAENAAWGGVGGLGFTVPGVAHALVTGHRPLAPQHGEQRNATQRNTQQPAPAPAAEGQEAQDAPLHPEAQAALDSLLGVTEKTPQDRVEQSAAGVDAMRMQALTDRVAELRAQLQIADPQTNPDRAASLAAELETAIGQHAEEMSKQAAKAVEAVPPEERASLLHSLLGGIIGQGAPAASQSPQPPSTAEPPDLGGLMAPKTWEEAAPIFERMQGVPSDREYYQNLDQSRRDAADNAAFMDEAKGLEQPGTVSGGQAEDVPSDFRMYESMGADELRRLLAERRMYTTGGKQALVQRLREADRAGVKTGTVAPDAPLDERGLQSRSPDVYEGQWPKYTQMPVEHLREIAANRDLDPKGGKAALVKRLEEDDAKVEEAPQQPGAVSAETSKEKPDEKQEEGQGQGLLSDKSPVESPAPAAGESDAEPSEFMRQRDATIKASKEAGNRHLDQEPRYVENSRGREIYNVHDPKERGVIRTVANTGEVVVHWSDKYSADANLATKKTEKRGRKSVEVYESWLMPSDLKDYVFKSATTGTTPSESQSPPSRAGLSGDSTRSPADSTTLSPASPSRAQSPAASTDSSSPSTPSNRNEASPSEDRASGSRGTRGSSGEGTASTELPDQISKDTEAIAQLWEAESKRINPDSPVQPRIVREKVVPKIVEAAKTGVFTDLLRPDNKVSRAVFEKLTGVKLPKTLSKTQALFTGKPFAITMPGAEKPAAPKATTKQSPPGGGLIGGGKKIISDGMATGEVMARAQKISEESDNEAVKREADSIYDMLNKGEMGRDEAIRALDRLEAKAPTKPLPEIPAHQQKLVDDLRAIALNTDYQQTLLDEWASAFRYAEPSKVPGLLDSFGAVYRADNYRTFGHEGTNKILAAIAEYDKSRPAWKPRPLAPATPPPAKLTGILSNLSEAEQARVEELKKRLAAKLRNELRSGFDPEMFAIGAELTALYVKAGLKGFGAYAKKMVADLGDGVKPYLKSFYNGARSFPGVDSAGMSAAADVERANVDAAIKIENDLGDGDAEVQDDTDKSERSEPGSGDGVSGGEGGTGVGPETTGDDGSQTGKSGDSKVPADAGGGVSNNDGKSARSRGGRGKRGGKGTRKPSAGTQSDGGAESQPGPRGEDQPAGPLHPKRPENVADRNHRIGPNDVIAPRGDDAKIRGNIAAISLLLQLEKEGRNPTPDEKRTLAKYVGWGSTGVARALDSLKAKRAEQYREAMATYQEQLKEWQDRGWDEWRKPRPPEGVKYEDAIAWEKQYGEIYNEIRGLVSDADFRDMQASTPFAHYTSADVITRGIWGAVRRLGFRGGSVLETSAGVGHMLGLQPADLAEASQWTAVEMDSIPARILGKLYPEATVIASDFGTAKIAPASVDLIVGNVPFAAKSISWEGQPKGLSLHNAFLARSLRMLRPGGLMVAITSRSTMDEKASDAFREWAAKDANLIGAIRLPEVAFQANAGTKVTTDILIFQKKKGPATGAEWAGRKKISVPNRREGGDIDIDLNEYFHAHPEMMLGKLVADGLYPDSSELDSTLEHIKGTDWLKALDDAVQTLPENLAEGGTYAPKAETGEGEGTIGVDAEGNPYKVSDGKREPLSGKDSKLAPFFRQWVGLKSDALKLFDLQVSTTATDDEIEAQRAKVRDQYHALVKNHGRMGARFADFRNDPAAFRVASLEKVTRTLATTSVGGKNKYVYKEEYADADILTRRTQFPFIEPVKADSIEDAATISRVWKGAIDLDYMGRLIGKTSGQVRQDLLDKQMVFVDPDSGLLVQRDEYLSGPVKDKLAKAEEAAKADSAYALNVDALKAVQPPRRNITSVTAMLGASWVPSEAYEDFAKAMLEADRSPISVVYSETVHAHQAMPSQRWNPDAADIAAGAGGMPLSEIIAKTINFERITVTVPGDRPGSYVQDPVATAAARYKQEQLQDKWNRWMKSSDWALRLEDEYNNKVNTSIARKHTPPNIETLPSADPKVKLRPHQMRDVSRGLGNSHLNAHEVGTGKTYIIISTAMEHRRLGLARKPMIVVQNSTVGAYARAFATLYPSARVLVPSDADFETKRRKRTLQSIASNDWDAVIVPQSQLEKIANDPEREREYVASMVDELEDAIIAEGVSDPDKARFSRDPKVKALARRLTAVKELGKKLLTGKRDTEVVSFEQLGVDALLVDEAHAYKKLAFVTVLPDIKGMDTGFSKRGLNMLLKTRFVQERRGGKNVHFYTGTPITNTIAEAWTMMRYLRPDVLAAAHISTFDEFVATFAKRTTEYEMQGGIMLKAVERLRAFNNVSTLQQLWLQVSDEQQAEAAGIPRPPIEGGGREIRTIPSTRLVTSLMRHLLIRYKAFENMSPKDRFLNKHIPGQINAIARAGAVDIRLVNPDLPDDPGSKLNVIAKEMHEIWKQTESFSGAQVLFLDRYRGLRWEKTGEYETDPETGEEVPKFRRVEKFNAFHELKRKLVKLGVPADQIAVVTDSEYDDTASREPLFDAVRQGKVRMVLASSERAGVGVNMQDRLVALHHGDGPFTAAMMDQREGRIQRQGNETYSLSGGTFKPRIIGWGVKGSYDSGQYERLARKAKIQWQFRLGENIGETIEDDEDVISYAQAAAEITGNPLFKERAELEEKIRGLRSDMDQFFQGQIYLKRRIEEAEASAVRSRESAAAAQRDIERYYQPYQDNPQVSVDGNAPVSTEEDITAAVKEYLDRARAEAEEKFTHQYTTNKKPAMEKSWSLAPIIANGRLLDLSVKASVWSKISSGSSDRTPDITFQLGHQAESKTHVGIINALDRMMSVALAKEYIAEREQSAESYIKEAADLRKKLKPKYENVEELDRHEARLREVVAELAAQGNDLKKRPEDDEDDWGDIGISPIVSDDHGAGGTAAGAPPAGGLPEDSPDSHKWYIKVDGKFIETGNAIPIKVDVPGLDPSLEFFEVKGRGKNAQNAIYEASTGLVVTRYYGANDASEVLKEHLETMDGGPARASEVIKDVRNKQGATPRYVAQQQPPDSPRLSPSSIRQLARDQGIEGADTAAPVILRRRIADNQIAQQDAANVQESLRATHGKGVTVEPVQPAPGLEAQLHSFLTRMGQTPVFLQIEGDEGAVQGLALGRDGSRVYIRAGLAESIAPGVALHELMHSLRSQNKELWSAVVDALGPDAMKDSIATYRSELVSNFGENSGVVARFDRSESLRQDEGLARAIERMATDPEIRAAMTAKPGLWARLKRWLKAQLERLGLGNEGAGLRKAVLDALDAMENGAGPGGGEGEVRLGVRGDDIRGTPLINVASVMAAQRKADAESRAEYDEQQVQYADDPKMRRFIDMTFAAENRRTALINKIREYIGTNGGAVEVGDSRYVISRSTEAGAKPWRVTTFKKYPQGWRAWGHTEHAELDSVSLSGGAYKIGAVQEVAGLIGGKPDRVQEARFSIAPPTDSPAFKALASMLGSDRAASNMVSVANESDVHALKGHAKAISDLLERKSFGTKRDGSRDIDLAVVPHMVAVSENQEVLGAIIRAIPVDVVNLLGRKQLSAENILRDKSVLKNVLSSNRESAVSLPVDVADSLVRVVARTATEIADLAGRLLELKPTGLARSDDSILGAHGVGSDGFGDTKVDPRNNPAFAKWFGSSKVVDKDGKPLVVYHGTAHSITAFDKTKIGQRDDGWYGRGFYFTPDADTAARYAETTDGATAGENVVPVYVALKNPYVWPDGRTVPYNANMRRALHSELVRGGYDGVIVPVHDEQGTIHEVVVFNSSQIKSATGNQGTFDPANPDIRFSVAPGKQEHPAPASISDITNAAIYVAGTALNQKVRDGRPLSALTKTLIDKVGKPEIKTDAARKNIRTLAKAILADSGPDGEGFARAVAAVKERRAAQDEKARDAKVAKRFKAKDAEVLSDKLTATQKRAAQMSKIEQKGADAATKAADKEMSKAAKAVVGVYNRTMREGRQRMAELIPEFIHQISTARKAERAMADFEHRSEVEGEGLPKGVYGLNSTPVDPSKPPNAAAKQRIADGIRSQVVRLLDNLPRPLRHKYLNAVKNTTTPAMLVGILNRMRRDLVRWDAKVRAAEARQALSGKNGVKVLEPEVEKEVVAARAEIVRALRAMRKRGTPMQELTTLREQVRDAANLIVSAFHEQAKQDEIRIGAETLDAAKARGQIIKTARAMPQLDSEGTKGNPETNIIKRTIRRRSGWESLSLLIDGGKQGGPAMALFRDVLKGRRNAIEMHHRFADGFGAIVTANGYNDLGKFLAEVSGVLGPAAHRAVKVKFGPHESLTLGQALYIYASMKDEGFLARVLPKYDDEGNVTRAGQPLQFKDANLDQPFTITAADLTRVAKAIPQNLRRIVDQGKQLYDETYFEKLSRTNKRLKGYFLEKVPGYWGIKIARKSGPDRGTPSNWKGAAIRALEAAGFMQERTGASKAPIAIGDFGVDILLRSRAASHTIHKSERVKALVRTLLHADPANPGQNVVTAIAKSLGADTVRRLETRIAMWSEGDMGMSADKTWRQIMGLWARAKTQLWIPTWLRNATGAAKLLNDLDPSDVAGGLSGLTWGTFKELRKYSPELRERWDGGGMGAFHTDEGAHVGHAGITDAAKMTFKQLAMAAGTAAQRGNAARGDLLKGSWRAWKSTVDAITVGNFFDAIPAMVAYRAFLKKAPKTLDAEGKKRWAARHATRVFERTANTSNTEYSNDVQLAARDSVMLASFIPFTGDLAKTQNMVYEAWQKGPKKFIRAATVIAFASALSSIVTALVRGAGGDDKDKALEAANQRFWDEIVSIAPGGSIARQAYKLGNAQRPGASVLDTPIGDLADQAAQLVQDMSRAWDRGDRPLRAKMLTAAELRNRAIMRAVDLGGDLSGIPIGQYRRFITQAIEKWSK